MPTREPTPERAPRHDPGKVAVAPGQCWGRTHEHRRRSMPVAFLLSLVAGSAIGAVDVLTMTSPIPSVVALAVAAFLITWVVPSRWLAVATTLTFVMWLAHIAVRVPWWPHPEEVGPHDWTGVLAAVPSLAGAMLAGVVQLARRKY